VTEEGLPHWGMLRQKQTNKKAFIGIVYEKEKNLPYRHLSRGLFSSYPSRYTNYATSAPSLAAISKNNIKEGNNDPF
jgi:hypothetical protein